MKSMFTRWVAVYVLLHAVASAQQSNTSAVSERLNAIVKFYEKDKGFMGAVLVAEDNRVLLNDGYGKAVEEWDLPNTPDVEFRLGSLTKQFTAALVLLLQQDGSLNIDDPVSKYLTDSPPTWAKVTVIDLLRHTSGIPDFTDDKRFPAWSQTPRSPGEILSFFRNKPLKFAPGSEYSYSNSNYEVLGAVIEKVSGKQYADLLKERILNPLGMSRTGVDTDELILTKRANGYSVGKDGLEVARSESMTVPWAAGALYSTTSDLLRWEQGLFGGKVLNNDSLRTMTTPGKGNYGLGVLVDQQDGLPIISHDGSIEGFDAFLSYIPERRIAVIVLGNVDGTAAESMGPQLRDVVLGKTVILANERKAVPIAASELPRFTGVYDFPPSFSLTIASNGNSITAQATHQNSLPALYQGVRNNHPTFFVVQVNAELEFIPDASGKIVSVVLHKDGGDMRGKKRILR